MNPKFDNFVETVLKILRRAGPEYLRLSLAAILVGVSLTLYVYLSVVPGFIGLMPCLILTIFLLYRSAMHNLFDRPSLGFWRMSILGLICALITLCDHLQFFYLQKGAGPPAANHPAVEVLVDTATLNDLGIAPHLAGVFFAPGEGNRDIYLWAGQKRRSYLSKIPALVARRVDRPGGAWRTGMGKPLSDAHWIPEIGQILTAIAEPPMVELRSPADLQVVGGATWPSGYPSLIDVAGDGTVRVLAEGEGEIARVDPRDLSLTMEDPLAPQVRTLGAKLPTDGLAPTMLTPPIGGRRYLSSWYAHMIALELDENFRVTRVYQQPENVAVRLSTLSVFRFFDFAWNPDGQEIWLANSMRGRGGELIELDRQSFSHVRTRAAPLGLRRLLYDERRDRLYALDALGGSLLVLRRKSGALEEVTRLEFGKLARVLQWEDSSRTRLLVGSSGGLFRVDPQKL